MGTFQIYRDKGEQYRWRLRARNHRIIADCGEGYVQQDDCEHGIDLVRRGDADIEIFQDAGGGFRWRMRAENGKIFADSGEGYANRSNCARAIKAVKRVAPGARIDDQTASAS